MKQLNIINNYDSNVGYDMFSKMPIAGIDLPNIGLDDDEAELDLAKLIDSEEVLTLIKKINTDKSSGLTRINSKVLKDSLLFLYKELTLIFLNSTSEGIFPTAWSGGTLEPIPKKR